MASQHTHLGELPTSYIVVEALNTYFSEDDIDLRDITNIAKQDPVVHANILFLVNEVFAKRNSPVVNTLSAAINLVGLEPLKQRLLSIQALDEASKSFACYELIRSRMYVAACLTQFWADYMGQASAEEMYCASMFTGLGDLSYCLHKADTIKHSRVDIESVPTLKTLYRDEPDEISLMPDSIQVIFQDDSMSERLKLSILVYELVACLEYSYSTEQLKQALLDLCDYVGIGIHRAGYDLARQLVHIERQTNYHVCHHSQFLLSTNMQALDPAENFM